ncbi:UNVERIFIED_CONTAM: putative mitochondrial protein [Sesamum indicum]
MDEKARRKASEDEIYSRLDHSIEVQEGLQASVLNIEHSLIAVQQQLQSIVEPLQQYNKNKSILGDGLTATMEKGSSSRVVIHNPVRTENSSPKRFEHQHSQHTKSYGALKKMEFPYFEGENERAWVRRCSRYFQLILVPENQRVTLASIYMQGKAELWYQGYTEKKEFNSWDELVVSVLDRFEDLDSERVMTEFNKLQHETSVNAYLKRFEELKDQMLIFNKKLGEDFFMMKFISGLKEEVTSFVSTCNPTSLNQAVNLGRRQEHTVNAILKRAHQPNRSQPPRPLFKPLSKQNPPRSSTQPRRFFTEAKVRDKRERNLCYRCDEPYVPGHRCKFKKVYMLLSNEDEQEFDQSGQEETINEVEATEIDVTVSLHASKDSWWEVQGHKFQHPVRLLKLGGYDLVLGCDWLGEYEDSTEDSTPYPRNRVMLIQSLARVIRRRHYKARGDLCIVQKQTVQEEGTKVSELLQQYEDIFQEPKSLPPERNIEHGIELLPNAIPKRQHPYRYAFGQKTEIEKIVKEMLQNGIIRPSQSSFASPVLLVKKKDSGWRLCVDYRKWNTWGISYLEIGVAINPQKIESMVNWPTPTTVKALRGFLGLTGYYRKFIKGYGTISKPLTELLKKDGFVWNQEAEEAFKNLKRIMTTTPVLAMPDFSQPFTVETDACGKGIEAVLMQNGRPITYLSKALSLKNMGLSIYEKEFLALLLAVTKWRHYLQDRQFIIKTDQRSLKHILDQRLDSILQHRWVSKLLGLNYEVQYKKGSENRAADALSRLEHGETELASNAITTQIPVWIQEVQSSYEGNTLFQTINQAKIVEGGSYPDYNYSSGLLKKGSRVCVRSHGDIRIKIISSLHDATLGGYSGVNGTYQRAKSLFYWPAMKQDIQKWVNVKSANELSMKIILIRDYCKPCPYQTKHGLA